jgi:phosphoglycolate phosphatase-like HAD superfamily hydrolase
MKVDLKEPYEKLMKAGHVIFDFDGTLYQIQIDWKELKKDLYRKARDMGLCDNFRSLRELYTKASSQPEIKNELVLLQTRYEKGGQAKAIRIEHGIKAAKWRISHGLGCSICSSNTRSTLMDMVGDWGFDPIVSLDDISNPKPDPEGILRIINGLDPSIHDVIMVGNSELDSQAAERAGIEYIDVSDIEERFFE